MNKSKFLKLIILFLLILNGILLSMHFHAQRNENGPRNLIIKKLHFDDAQIKKYDSLILIHRKSIIQHENEMNQSRNNLYLELNKTQNQNIINSIVEKIGNLQMKAEMLNYKHFLEIKSICKPNQQESFQSLTKEFSKLFNKRIHKSK